MNPVLPLLIISGGWLLLLRHLEARELKRMHDCHSDITAFHDQKVTLPMQERDEMRGRRDANRRRLKEGLKRDGEPAPIGCHSQGSYAM